MPLDSGHLSLQISPEEAVDAVNIGAGVYSPVTGFLGLEDLESVVQTGRLVGGSPLGLPLVLDAKSRPSLPEIPEAINLICGNEVIASVSSPEFFEWRDLDGLRQLFGTDSLEHPGVSRFRAFSGHFVGGRVDLNHDSNLVRKFALTGPESLRKRIAERGWKTVVGFQTRNVPHRAHEQLIRTALEVFDGVLVQPLVGPRKSGDFTEEAIEAGYKHLLSKVFPKSRVEFSFLRARMNYGGPREAVLHSVMRRNFGCTHFIVGRDHAGVANFYPEYAAQDYCATFGDELKIQILNMAGPYFCSACDSMVSRKSCMHSNDSELVSKISGTQVREALRRNEYISPKIMRPEIIDAVSKVKLFI